MTSGLFFIVDSPVLSSLLILTLVPARLVNR